MTTPGVPAGSFLLDVRTGGEWAAGHAPDAVHIPLAELPDRVAEVPTDQPVVAICRSGGRSAKATEFLLAKGCQVVNYEGGMGAWEAAGGAMVAENGQPPTVA